MGSSKSSNTTTTQTVTTTQSNNAAVTQVANGLSAEGIIGIINALGGSLTGQQAANGAALSNYFSSGSTGSNVSPLGSDTDTAAAPAASGTSWLPVVILAAAAAGVIYFLKRKKGA